MNYTDKDGVWIVVTPPMGHAVFAFKKGQPLPTYFNNGCHDDCTWKCMQMLNLTRQEDDYTITSSGDCKCPRSGYWRLLNHAKRPYIACGEEFPIKEAIWYFDQNQNPPEQDNDIQQPIPAQPQQ